MALALARGEAARVPGLVDFLSRNLPKALWIARPKSLQPKTLLNESLAIFFLRQLKRAFETEVQRAGPVLVASLQPTVSIPTPSAVRFNLGSPLPLYPALASPRPSLLSPSGFFSPRAPWPRTPDSPESPGVGVPSAAAVFGEDSDSDAGGPTFSYVVIPVDDSEEEEEEEGQETPSCNCDGCAGDRKV
jgi:hypothetical protein